MKKWHLYTQESINKIASDAITKAFDHIYLTLGIDVSNAFSDMETETLADVIWEKIPTENKQI
jgi:hypothetical protein